MSKTVELDVTERFGVKDLDDNELYFCLFEKCSYSRTPSSSSSSGEQSVLFSTGQASDWAIKLIYRKNRLEKVFTRLGEAEIVTIEDLIKRELLSPPIQKIRRMFMFASLPVKGFFLVKDKFQLCPPPSNASKPPFLCAEHPFVCEISASSSNLPLLNNFRLTVRFQEIGLLLNLLLEFGIRFPSKMGRHVWVIGKTERRSCNGEKHFSELCQEGYTVEGFNAVAEEFSETRGWCPLEEVESKVYYHQLGISPVRDALKVAEDTQKLVNKYFLWWIL